MAMSLKAAMMVQGNDVACHSTGPYSNGKYGFEVWMLRGNEYHTLVVSLGKGIYDTSSTAVQAAEAMVGTVKEMDLSGNENIAANSIGVVFGGINHIIVDHASAELKEEEDVVQ